MQKHLNFN